MLKLFILSLLNSQCYCSTAYTRNNNWSCCHSYECWKTINVSVVTPIVWLIEIQENIAPCFPHPRWHSAGKDRNEKIYLYLIYKKTIPILFILICVISRGRTEVCVISSVLPRQRNTYYAQLINTV